MVDHTIFKNSEQFKGLDTKSSDVSRNMQYSSDMRNAMYKLSGAICKRKGFTLSESFTEEIKGMYTFKNVSNRTGVITDEMLSVVGTKIRSYKEERASIGAYLDKDIIVNNKYGLSQSDYDNIQIKLQYDSATNMFYVYQDGSRIYELYITEDMSMEELNERLSWGVQSIYNQAICDDVEFFATSSWNTNGAPSTRNMITRIEFGDIQAVQNNKILNEALSIIRSRGANYFTKISTDLQNIPSTHMFNPLMRVNTSINKVESVPANLDYRWLWDEQKTWYRVDSTAFANSADCYWYIPSEDIVVKRTPSDTANDTLTQHRVELYDGSYAFYDKDPFTGSDYDKAVRDNMWDSIGYSLPISGYITEQNKIPVVNDFFSKLVKWTAPYETPLDATNTLANRNTGSETIYPTNTYTKLNFKHVGIKKESINAITPNFTIDDVNPASYFFSKLKQRYPNWLTTTPTSNAEYFSSNLDWSQDSVGIIEEPEFLIFTKEISSNTLGFNSTTQQHILNSISTIKDNATITDYYDKGAYSSSYTIYSVGTFPIKSAPQDHTDLYGNINNLIGFQYYGKLLNLNLSSSSYYPGDWYTNNYSSNQQLNIEPQFLSKSPIRIEVIDGSSSLQVRDALNTFTTTLTSANYNVGNRVTLRELEDTKFYLTCANKNTTSLNSIFWQNTYEDNVLYEPSTENCSFASLNEVVYVSNGLDHVKKYDGKYVYRAGLPNATDPSVQGNDQYDISNQYMYLFEYTDYQGNIISGEPRYIPASDISTFNFPGADNSIFEGFDTTSTFNLEWQAFNNQIIADAPTDAFRIEKVADERRMRIKIYDNLGSSNNLHYLAYDIGVLDTDFKLSEIGGVSYASEQDTNLAYQPDVKRHDPPPKGRYLSTFKNCLVVSGQYENANNIQYSLPYSSSTLEIGSEYFPSDDNAVIVESKEGDRLTGMYSFRDILYVFHDSSISALSGDIGLLETPSVRSISQEAGIGCVSNSSIQELNGQVVFLSSKGFYSIYNTVQIRKFSDIIENLFITTSSINRQLNRSVSFIWEAKELFICVIPQLEYDQASSRYLLNKDKTLLLGYDYSKDAWLRWDNLEFTGGAAIFKDSVYFSKIENATSYKICKISDDNLSTDYSDEGSPINFYYETNWESLQMPSIPKKFLRLKMHFMDVDKDFENDGFSLKIGIYKDYIQGETSSINMNLDNIFNQGWGDFSWAIDTWGGNWGGGVNNIFVKHKLPNFKAKSLKLVFSNNDNNQNVLINNWEYEIANTYRQEIKD